MVTYVEGFLDETVYNTNADLSAMFRIGFKNTDKKIITSETNTVNIEEIEAMNAALTLVKGDSPNDKLTIKGIVDNPSPFRWMLNTPTELAGVYTAVACVSGNKPSVTFFLQDGVSKYAAFGNKANQLDFNCEIDQGGLLTFIESFIGATHGVSVATPTVTGYNLLGAVVGGRIYSNPTFKFNTVSYSVQKAGGQMQQKLTPLIGTSGQYQRVENQSSTHAGITIMFKAGLDVSAIKTIKDASSSNEKAIELQFLAIDDPTKYLKISGTAMCAGMETTRVENSPEICTAVFVLAGNFEVSWN